MATTTETRELPTRDLLVLLSPFYADKVAASALTKAGLLVFDKDREEYGWTPAGEALVAEIRQRHAMTFEDDPGGGRWHVGGQGLHCGDMLEMMLGDGRWQRVRFEVEFDHRARNGRLPCFYITLAGGHSMVCSADWTLTLFRLPEKQRR